jgi:hypothetical protein
MAGCILESLENQYTVPVFSLLLESMNLHTDSDWSTEIHFFFKVSVCVTHYYFQPLKCKRHLQTLRQHISFFVSFWDQQLPTHVPYHTNAVAPCSVNISAPCLLQLLHLQPNHVALELSESKLLGSESVSTSNKALSTPSLTNPCYVMTCMHWTATSNKNWT